MMIIVGTWILVFRWSDCELLAWLVLDFVLVTKSVIFDPKKKGVLLFSLCASSNTLLWLESQLHNDDEECRNEQMYQRQRSN